MIGIYSIKSLVKNKLYIGCSNNIERRFNEHILSLKKGSHHNLYLQRTFNKYGLESFEFTIIEEVESIDLLQEKEVYYISKYQTSNKNKGYNLTLGGEDLCVLSKESKIKKRETIIAKLDPIYCYTITGELIGKFKCVPDVSKDLNLNKNSIMNALQRGIQLKGYLFYKTPKSFTQYYPNYHKTKIFVFNSIGDLIDTVDKMKVAAEKYNINFNTMNTLCNRKSLYKNQYYFVKEKQLEAFGEDKIAMRLFDHELKG